MKKCSTFQILSVVLFSVLSFVVVQAEEPEPVKTVLEETQEKAHSLAAAEEGHPLEEAEPATEGEPVAPVVSGVNDALQGDTTTEQADGTEVASEVDATPAPIKDALRYVLWVRNLREVPTLVITSGNQGGNGQWFSKVEEAREQFSSALALINSGTCSADGISHQLGRMFEAQSFLHNLLGDKHPALLSVVMRQATLGACLGCW